MNSIFFAFLALCFYSAFQFGAKGLSHVPPYLITAFLGTVTAVYGWVVSAYFWKESSDSLVRLYDTNSLKHLILLGLISCAGDAAFVASYYYKGNPVTVVSIVSVIPIVVGVAYSIQTGKSLGLHVWVGIFFIVFGIFLVLKHQPQ
jgi:drug/metabolite transporter (DMT)-like permease